MEESPARSEAAHEVPGKTPAPSGWLAGGSLFAGAAALIGASCCVLPIVLVNLGLSGALVSKLAYFARAKDWMLGLSVLLIAGGVVLAAKRGRMGARTFALLVAAAVMVAAAYVFPSYEDQILRWLNLR